jgi:hypothetical protein
MQEYEDGSNLHEDSTHLRGENKLQLESADLKANFQGHGIKKCDSKKEDSDRKARYCNVGEQLFAKIKIKNIKKMEDNFLHKRRVSRCRSHI